MKHFLFSISFFILFLNFYNCYSKDDNSNTENIIGVNYHFVYNESSKPSTNFIDFTYQVCDKLENNFLIPFLESDIGFNIKNDDPNWHLAIISGLKTELFTNKKTIIFGAIDFGAGIIGGKTNHSNHSSFTGFIGKLGLNFGYKNIIIRYGLNLYSYSFPYKSDTEIGLGYAF